MYVPAPTVRRCARGWDEEFVWGENVTPAQVDIIVSFGDDQMRARAAAAPNISQSQLLALIQVGGEGKALAIASGTALEDPAGFVLRPSTVAGPCAEPCGKTRTRRPAGPASSSLAPLPPA
ncbi:hypothetical protein [Rathayibacter rathayi]|uniref:Uncharacterized protein n=1 Tax=Rathayibacter rathayi TaxID=33887 RepID=A0ABX5AH04_RATRA|nr:hypothetical protein [Rathayibacter rathayi]PPF24294.1 hypothetical protein C5C34_06080 [Rathayibacter rathayi]PPF51615.1 hypothetical protein C5C08_02070 [Rathayibacter rathayi]PPG47036.1 hypothetical protein C5C20_02065 [Rathayibacter rathayi]PPG96503.1 hypothetical protein C5C22_02460 [Rathayibacter rathayi]PPH38952.1 hypothetical protein C5C28_01920 [Rathayibacter rathayi]